MIQLIDYLETEQVRAAWRMYFLVLLHRCMGVASGFVYLARSIPIAAISEEICIFFRCRIGYTLQDLECSENYRKH
jgi:hypothetical protein